MNALLPRDFLEEYPEPLRRALCAMARSMPANRLYVAGGPVRDWLLGRVPCDLDLTVASGAVAAARQLARDLGGTFVLLDADEDVARVVWQGLSIDFSSFRNGCGSIEEDLGQRDFTINALAVAVSGAKPGLASLAVIDPAGGVADLAARRIRIPSPASLLADPLRLLRAYRFSATLAFAIEPGTLTEIARHRELILRPAMERIAYELALIMASARAAATVAALAASGLLWLIFPELRAGEGLGQPASHHLDVFAHNLEALRRMEELLGNPAGLFPGQGPLFARYLAQPRTGVLLKWAALFHDVGKPATHETVAGRITFYNHDRAGAGLFAAIAERLRWRRDDRQRVTRLIDLHMWPFHLCNARLKTGITRKACLRLVKAAEDDLAGLFLLAMADSLAGQGPGRPERMEERLADLFAEVNGVYEEHIKPLFSRPPLLSGHDLIREFSLAPGPVFREILDGLERAQVEGEVRERSQALAWVRAFLDGEKRE
ncbi:HDIG domain-containing metalloprotein [Thiovibrio sp. JS02]